MPPRRFSWAAASRREPLHGAKSVAGVVDEFERQLEALRRGYQHDPRGEMLRLFLLALEREELVSIAYRESLMARRLAEMELDGGIRELIRHALVWAWKDEEMHAIYIRGALLRIGTFPLRLRTFLAQIAGAIAGWASSTLQHATWRRAPFSRGLASLVSQIGSLAGRVPSDVSKHLRYRSFRDFCLFNVDAEQTAALCWQRIVELAEGHQELGQEQLRDFSRVVEDERRHAQIFEILSDSLDAEDRLAEGVTAQELARRIAAVGNSFLPRSFRQIPIAENPLGSGGRVWCERGSNRGEKRALFQSLLEKCDLLDALRERAAWLGLPVERVRVAIKPTFMLTYHRDDPSPRTDPELVELLARYFRSLGCADVAVVEGRNIYDRFYSGRSVTEVAAYAGYDSPDYRIVDASDDQIDHTYRRGMAQYTVSRTWKDADFRVSFAKLRSHPIELALLAVGNVEWVGARCDEFLFVERQADRSTAVMMLLDEFPPHYALIDGYVSAPDGLVGVMGCRRPPDPFRLWAGRDALAVDVVAGRAVGIRRPSDSSLLEAACHWFGGWSDSTEVVGAVDPVEEWRGPFSNEVRAFLSFFAWPIYVGGSGRGRLFVPAMDEDAFPPIGHHGRLLRIQRRLVQLVLGLPCGPLRRAKKERRT